MQSWTKVMCANTNRCGSVKMIELRNYCDSKKIIPSGMTQILDQYSKPFIQKNNAKLAEKLTSNAISYKNSATLTGTEKPGIEDIFKSNQKNFNFDAQYEKCNFELVESIPTGLAFHGKLCHTSTFDAWLNLLKGAEKSIDIAAFYWNLLDKTDYETSWQGKEIFNAIIAAAERGVKVRIAQNAPSKIFPQEDSAILAKNGIAEVRSLHFESYGKGVLHTKMWVIDDNNIFLGSANMDWRSLTEVKELGVVVRNNPSIALDLGKIFSVYWEMGQRRLPPKYWSTNLKTSYNKDSPLRLQCAFNHEARKENSEREEHSKDFYKANVFLSSCPNQLNTKNREHDIEALLFAIENASKYVRISVMEYLPATLFMRRNNRYWPIIDDAIRSAAFRGIRVEMLVSKWKHTKKEMTPYLKSLLQINPALKSGQISVKLFTVPSDEKQFKLEHARVNHAKYMVTDKAAFIGTSNWAGDYFITTAGVSMVIKNVDSYGLVDQFNEVFLRDWNSEYAEFLEL